MIIYYSYFYLDYGYWRRCYRLLFLEKRVWKGSCCCFETSSMTWVGSVNQDLVPKPHSVCVCVCVSGSEITESNCKKAWAGSGRWSCDKRRALETSAVNEALEETDLSRRSECGGIGWRCCGEKAVLDVADGAQHVWLFIVQICERW